MKMKPIIQIVAVLLAFVMVFVSGCSKQAEDSPEPEEDTSLSAENQDDAETLLSAENQDDVDTPEDEQQEKKGEADNTEAEYPENGKTAESEAVDSVSDTSEKGAGKENTGSGGESKSEAQNTSSSGNSETSSNTGSSDNSGTSSSAETHVHSYSKKTVAATCTAQGYTLYTCSCGDSYKDDFVNALGHTYTDKAVAATCTTDGYTLHTCSRCGNSYQDNTVKAPGHSYVDTVVAPTTSDKGYTEHVCSVCGDSYKDNYTDPVPVTLDLNAAAAAGNSYMQSLGITIDYSLNASNAGYDFPDIGSRSYYEMAGQSVLNANVIAKIEATMTYHGRDDFIAYARANCYVSYDASTDYYYIYVFYG